MSASVARRRHQSPFCSGTRHGVAARGGVIVVADWTPPSPRHASASSVLSRCRLEQLRIKCHRRRPMFHRRRMLRVVVSWSDLRRPNDSSAASKSNRKTIRRFDERERTRVCAALPAPGHQPPWRRHRRPRRSQELIVDFPPISRFRCFGMSSSFALKNQHHQQHHLHQQQQQHSASSFSVHDILCTSLDDYYSASTAVSTSLPAGVRASPSVVKDAELDRASATSVTEDVHVTDRAAASSISDELIGSLGVGGCDRDQYNGQLAAAAAFYAGSNVALYGSMSSGGGTVGGGACSPHHHTLHHHNHHHHPHHHPAAAAAAAAAFASQYAGGPTELAHYTGSGGSAGFAADSMPVRGCVGGPWYAPSPAPDPRLTSKLISSK